jgi:hypothetical protein
MPEGVAIVLGINEITFNDRRRSPQLLKRRNYSKGG